MLNYSARGGMSVTTDTIAGQSRLLLARADPRDSGNYTCVPGPGATPASVTVHVLNGMNNNPTRFDDIITCVLIHLS